MTHPTFFTDFHTFQDNAVHCMKNGELTIFTDIVNDAVKEDIESKDVILPKEHWINQSLKTEDDKTLLLKAIELGLPAFVEVLLRSKADPNLYSNELMVTPLIFATKSMDLTSMRLLTQFGANVNAVAFNNGQTALHAACDRGFTLGVSYLLSLNAEIDIKDKKGNQTPLYLALKAKDEESVRLLIAHGANLEQKVFGKTLKDHTSKKMPQVNPDSIPKLKAPMERQTSTSTLEKLADIIGDVQNNDDLEMFKSLLIEVDENDLQNYNHRGHNLLQMSCYKKKDEHALALLERGMDVNGLAEGSMMPPLLISATLGDTLTLVTLLKHNADFKMTKIGTKETLLHCFLKQDRNMNPEDLQAILLTQDMKSIINKKDINGNTALHYAAQRWPQEGVRYILEAGANIGMKNQFNEVAITQILPETFENFLNEFCMKSNHGDVNHENFELTFNYNFLAPSNEDLPNALQKSTDPEDPAETKLVSDQDEEKNALPETEALWHMGQSKEHRHLLKHPVIASFLWLKWARIRRYFNRNLRFYLLFVYLLTWYIFQQFGGNSISINKDLAIQGAISIPFFYGLFVAFSVIMTGFILKDWSADLKDLIRDSKEMGPSSLSILQTIFSNWIEVAFLIGLIFIIIFGAQSLYFSLIILTALLAIREFFQIGVSLRRYLLSPENWIEVTTIILVCIILFHQGGHPADELVLKRHLSSIAIVLSWTELITLVGKHPKLTRYNVYVTMFYKVLSTFCFFLLWYAFFIIAFGLAFYIMLHKDDGSVPDPDAMVFFNKPWLALVKTSTMFVGELEFSDIPIDIENALSPLAYVFLLCFVFLIVVVLMNLLNGLAVSDTGIIQEKAEIVTYISRVDTISYTESVLLGDPFGFLTNWPAFKWLKNVPNMSCCTPLHQNKTFSAMFHKITGATGILLFYSFMEEASLTFKPNEKSYQCCLKVENMDETVIRSAKNIISEQNKDDKIDKLEAKMETMERILVQMSQKLDTLLTK